MITPSNFKKICKEVFGESNCEFQEYKDVSVYRYIDCFVDGKQLSKLTIRDEDLSTSCWVAVNRVCIDVNYNFTLKRRLKQASNSNASTRKKLFDVYVAITKKFPEMNSKAVVTIVTQYLVNVEFVGYEDIMALYKGLFESITHNNPKIKYRLATDMEAYFHETSCSERGISHWKDNND